MALARAKEKRGSRKREIELLCASNARKGK